MGGLGEASNDVDVAPVAWAVAGSGSSISGDVGGEEMELGAGVAVGLIKAVSVKSVARRWCSEPGLGKSGPGCHMSVLEGTVGNHAGKIHALNLARMPALGLAAAAPLHLSAARPRSASWLPSSCAL